MQDDSRLLEVTHEGTSQVKGSRVTYLTREYGLLEMKSSEGIRRCIHNSLIVMKGGSWNLKCVMIYQEKYHCFEILFKY